MTKVVQPRPLLEPLGAPASWCGWIGEASAVSPGGRPGRLLLYTSEAARQSRPLKDAI